MQESEFEQSVGHAKRSWPSLDAHWTKLAPFATLRVAQHPNGPKLGAVALFHGCGGVQPFLHDYAQTLHEAGIASLVVDSYGPRNISKLTALALVCSGAMFRGGARTRDVLAALHFLRNHPAIDEEQLGLAGWSHGGWAIMEALALPPHRLAQQAKLGWPDDCDVLAGLKQVFLAYPWCGVGAHSHALGWRRAVSARVVLAGRDQVVGTKWPDATMARLQRDGQDLVVTRFSDANHAFDVPNNRDPRFRFLPDATRSCHAILREQMQRLRVF